MRDDKGRYQYSRQLALSSSNEATPTNHGFKLLETPSPPTFPPPPSPPFRNLTNRVPTFVAPYHTPVTPSPKPHKSQLGVRGSKLQPNINFAPKPLSHIKPFSNWILEHQTAFSCVATLRPQNTLASSHHYPHPPSSSVYIARDAIHPHPYVIALCLSKCALPHPEPQSQNLKPRPPNLKPPIQIHNTKIQNLKLRARCMQESA